MRNSASGLMVARLRIAHPVMGRRPRLIVVLMVQPALLMDYAFFNGTAR